MLVEEHYIVYVIVVMFSEKERRKRQTLEGGWQSYDMRGAPRAPVCCRDGDERWRDAR